MDVNQTVSFPGGATKNLLGGATKSLLGGKYKVDNHDCSNCPTFLSREEEEDHLELIKRVRDNVTSQLRRGEDELQEKVGEEQEEDHLELINRVRDNVTSQLRRGEGDLQDRVGEEQKEKCGQCGKRYARRGMVKHMKEKHGEKLKCNICDEELKTEKTLENHFAKKHIVNTIAFLECNSCEYKTMNKYYMTDHEKRQHGNGNNEGFNSFVCSKCYTRKPNEYLLKKHQQQHVTSICVVCKKTFNSTKNLRRHKQIHEIQRCPECGKNFN